MGSHGQIGPLDPPLVMDLTFFSTAELPLITAITANKNRSEIENGGSRKEVTYISDRIHDSNEIPTVRARHDKS